MLRRETLIALRARHTAFRIAVEILYPPQTPPPLPLPTGGTEGNVGWESWRQRRKRRFRQALSVALAAWMLLWYAFLVYAVMVL